MSRPAWEPSLSRLPRGPRRAKLATCTSCSRSRSSPSSTRDPSGFDRAGSLARSSIPGPQLAGPLRDHFEQSILGVSLKAIRERLFGGVWGDEVLPHGDNPAIHNFGYSRASGRDHEIACRVEEVVDSFSEHEPPGDGDVCDLSNHGREVGRSVEVKPCQRLLMSDITRMSRTTRGTSAPFPSVGWTRILRAPIALDALQTTHHRASGDSRRATCPGELAAPRYARQGDGGAVTHGNHAPRSTAPRRQNRCNRGITRICEFIYVPARVIDAHKNRDFHPRSHAECGQTVGFSVGAYMEKPLLNRGFSGGDGGI